MDSSYQVRTNVSVKGVLFEALAYIVHIRERNIVFSLVCELIKDFKIFEVKVDA